MEVMLAVAQVQRYQVVRAAVDGHMANRAALGRSVRQVQRLKRRVEAAATG